MKKLFLILTIIITVLLTVNSVIAEDCEILNDNNICWENGASTTLSWTHSRITWEEYQVEARDFNWLGSFSVRVIKKGIVKDGVLSEGESYLFDFSNGSTFEGIKITADQVSNINLFPPNIGRYPANPQAKISFKTSLTKKPSLEISVDAERETGSEITAYINTENPGDSDLVDTEIRILYDGMELMNDLDSKDSPVTEVTASGTVINWEDDIKYRLTPIYPGIIRNGFSIKILNFSNKTALVSIGYDQLTKTNELVEGDSLIFGFTRENEYVGVKISGKNISSDAAELVLQFPKKNSLMRRYPDIPAGSNESLKLKFLPDYSGKTYTISVTASGKDKEGNIYKDSATKTVSIPAAFDIQKTVSDSILGEGPYPEITGFGDIASIKNITFVSIRVDNKMNYPVYGVKLKDTILPGFDFVDNMNRTSLSWDFDINASDHKEFTYTIMAKRQGVYIFPGAELTWAEKGEEVLLLSNGPQTNVSGPYIVVERNFNRTDIHTGETVSVSLSITNTGDLPANITVKDSVPLNATFLSGNLSFSGFLRPRQNEKIAYSVLANDNVLEFKVPEMISKNQGFKWYAPLPSIKISGNSPLPTAIPIIQSANTDVLEQLPDTGNRPLVNEWFSGLGGAISIIALFSGILMLLMLNKIKYFRINEK
jgi:uncharacterized repeat protein (TIGR01451 family)